MGPVCGLRVGVEGAGADTEGKKNGSAWLNLCERAKSSGKVLHWSNKILHAHFPDYCIAYFSCLSVNTKKDKMIAAIIIFQSSKIILHNIIPILFSPVILNWTPWIIFYCYTGTTLSNHCSSLQSI